MRRPMRRRGPVVFAVLTLEVLAVWGTDRAARAAGFDLDLFKPAAASTGYLCEDSGRILRAGALDVGLSFGYSRQPLVRRDQFSGSGGGDIVKDRFTGFLIGSFGIADRFDVGLRVPAVIGQSGDVDVDISEGGGVLQRPRARALGDIDLLARLLMVGRPDGIGFRLTLNAPFGIPTGAPDALTGNGTVTFRPRVVAGWESDRLSVALSAGYELRRPAEVPSSNLVVGNAVVAGAGAAYAFLPRTIWMLAEASTSVGTSQSETGVFAIPAQALVGGRALLARRFIVVAGAGTGLNRAPGSPRFRGLLTLTYAWGPGAR